MSTHLIISELFPALTPSVSFSTDSFTILSTRGLLDPHKTTPVVTRVVFNAPATIVFWDDGTKTVVKCQPGDEYDKEKGLAMAFSKKLFGNYGRYNDEFHKWID